VQESDCLPERFAMILRIQPLSVAVHNVISLLVEIHEIAKLVIVECPHKVRSFDEFVSSRAPFVLPSVFFDQSAC